MFPISVVSTAYQSTEETVRRFVLGLRDVLTQGWIDTAVTRDVLIILGCTAVTAAGRVELDTSAVHSGGEDEGDEDRFVEHGD